MASQPDESETVFRIVSKEFPPFDGTGTFRFGSRWISPGRWVVHTAASYSLAVLENLVHWQVASLPGSLVYVTAHIPDTLAQEYVPTEDLPKTAQGDYTPFREIGDAWYDDAETAILWVPSLVAPGEWNVMINQMHSGFAAIAVSEPRTPYLDQRLFPTRTR